MNDKPELNATKEDIVIEEQWFNQDPFSEEESANNSLSIETDELFEDDPFIEEALNGVGYNPNRDKSTGQFTFGTGGVVMSEKAAKEATKDSVYKEVLYHGTSGDSAKSIAQEGFESKKNREDTLFGQGTYLTPNPIDARSYAVGSTKIDENNPPQIIRSYIDTRNPYIVKMNSDPISDATNKALGVKGYKTDSDGYPTDIPQFVNWQREYSKNVNKLLETHDAIIFEQTVAGGNPMVVVGDTSKIKIFKIEHANEALKI